MTGTFLRACLRRRQLLFGRRSLLLFGDTVLLVVIGYDIPDAFCGVKQIAERAVMIERIDDVGDILAQITAAVPGFLQKLGSLIDQVGGKDFIDDSLIISLVQFLEAVCKQTEGGEEKDCGMLSYGYITYRNPDTCSCCGNLHVREFWPRCTSPVRVCRLASAAYLPPLSDGIKILTVLFSTP